MTSQENVEIVRGEDRVKGDALTTTEKRRLGKLEETIERGLKTFIEVGQALMEIRNAKLYRANHGTFEAYCRERWGMSRRHANRTIKAAGVAEIVGPNGPKSEAQARELVPLLKDEKKLVTAFRRAQQRSLLQGRPLSAQMIQQAVNAVGRVERASGFMKMSPAGTWRGPTRALSVSEIPTALAASERARDASDQIRARAGLPPVPDSATVAAWRRRLTEQDGSKPPRSLEKIVSTIEDLKATLPAAAHAPLDEAIAALKRARKKAGLGQQE